jgi:type I restriction enzyme S subunit
VSTIPIRHLVTVQLGKMLQTEAGSTTDSQVPYLKLGTVGSSEMTFGQTMFASPRDIEQYQVTEGDLVVAEGGDVGRTAFVPVLSEPTIIQNSLHRLRSRRGSDLRFVRYSLEAVRDSGWLGELCNKATFGHLTREKLTSLLVPDQSPHAQRAIADYLDAETARIDALIEKKKRMVNVVTNRLSAVVERGIRGLADEWGVSPLKYAVRGVEVGIVIKPSALYVDLGFPALRGFNVKPGRIILEDVIHISEEGDRLHSKSRLQAGDVVVVRTGQAGAAATIPAELDGYNCIDLVIIRPGTKTVPKYLEWVINSDWTQKYIEEHSVGTIQAHFNVGSMKAVPVPIPPLEVQRHVVAELERASSVHGQALSRMQGQIDLLGEHRQALITAAVTGELEIEGAAA